MSVLKYIGVEIKN